MKQHRLFRTALLSALLTFVLSTGGVMAAETRTPIKNVNLNISSTIESGSSRGNVTVTTSDSEYRVGDVEILNDNSDWMGGMQPRVAISLYAPSAYYFYSSSKSMFSLSGEDATFVTASRDNDKSELTLTIRLDKLENGDLSLSGLQWDESSGTAMWDENPSAKYYHVRLYRDGSSVTSARTTYESYYEFAGDITRRGDYSFEVRAIGSGSEKGDWESSDTWYISSSEADDLSYNDAPFSGGPGASSQNTSGTASGGPGATSATGSQGSVWCLDQYGWWYRNADGSYPKNGFYPVGDRYYCFNESGYMRTGWILFQNRWYYCGTDGALWGNCRTPDGYYVGGDGAWIP